LRIEPEASELEGPVYKGERFGEVPGRTKDQETECCSGTLNVVRIGQKARQILSVPSAWQV